MSAMYRDEVPAYGTLLDLVSRVNVETLAHQVGLKERLEATDNLERISEERHGAIRLGTGAELAMVRRIFAVMGMYPVGYYDLSAAGVPVHSTAFRPVGDAALKRNPFRVFTSLLRLDLIPDERLRETAYRVLNQRRIFSESVVALTEMAERQGGLSKNDAECFIVAALEIFRWHSKANVDERMYQRLHDAHRLIADIVSFQGPHINHLTPRTLDIDRVQTIMPEFGIRPKAVVEGPPPRHCPILLRQTSFKALEEPISFRDETGIWKTGLHTARFGEIEQRGIALTPKGRALYDELLDATYKIVRPEADGSNALIYEQVLREKFMAFPDDWTEIRKMSLGYFRYSITDKGRTARLPEVCDAGELLERGLVEIDPIVYEDFLPVSAAGIFHSNLQGSARANSAGTPNQKDFEFDLGINVLNEFDHYAHIEQASLETCIHAICNL